MMHNSDFNEQQQLGSKTAKGGFQNEKDVVGKFINYKSDQEAQEWLEIMGYDIYSIQSLDAKQIPTRLSRSKAHEYNISDDSFDFTQKYKKADIQVQLSITVDGIIYRENISLKKANVNANFNQIDKRPVDTYQEMWGFNSNIANTLKKFTGEIPPNEYEAANLQLKDKKKRRFYLDELPVDEVQELLMFFEENKSLIFNDILRGRGKLAAEWFLVTKIDINNEYSWILKNINEVVNFYMGGSIELTNQGGLKLGRLTAQRKGGTPDPTSLQFKINPNALFSI